MSFSILLSYSYFVFLLLNCTFTIHIGVANTQCFHYITILCTCHYALSFLKYYWSLIFLEEYSKEEIEFHFNAYTISPCASTPMSNYFELSSTKVIPLFCSKLLFWYSYLQRYHVIYVFVFVSYFIHEIIFWFFIETAGSYMV